MKKGTMKYFRLLGAVVIISLLCVMVKINSFAVVVERPDGYYTPLSKIPKGSESSYITLIDETEYEVKTGDTLWDISREFTGDGMRYHEIFEANDDILTDADYILPGEKLIVPEYSYLHGVGGDSYVIENTDACLIATPWGVENKCFLQTYLDFSRYSSGITIYDMTVKNRMKENELTKNWEDFVKEVERCSKEICGGRVTNLAFEKYKVKGGCDLCGYTFDFDTGDKVMELAVFYRLGAGNMAEVIGIREKVEDSRLLDYTRYTAASFEDYGGQIHMGFTKTSDYNGADKWDYPELHNVFSAAMSSYIVEAKRPEKNMPGDYEIEWEEPLLEQAVRDALAELWQLDETEKKEFSNRALMASDVAVITDIYLGRYYSGEESKRDKKELRLCLNGHSEYIVLEKDADFACSDFSHFTNTESLTISIATTNFSFIGNMVHLKELFIAGHEGMPLDNVNFLAGLEELKLLSLSGNEDGFSKITDLAVLKDSKKLKYLFLTMPCLTDFSFLEECTEICTIELKGTINGVKPVTPDLELLPNARFINFYDESIRWDY